MIERFVDFRLANQPMALGQFAAILTFPNTGT